MTWARAVRAIVAGLALAQAGAASAQPPPGAVPGPSSPGAPVPAPDASTPSPGAPLPPPDATAPGAPTPDAATPTPAAGPRSDGGAPIGPAAPAAVTAAPASPPVASVAAVDASARPARTGFFGGLGLGAAAMGVECGPSCAGMDAAAALSGYAGFLLTSGLSVVYDGSLLVHLDDSPISSVRVYLFTHLLSLQGWLGPRVWLRGGPGLVHLRINHVGIGVRAEAVPALGTALGVEVLRADPIVLEGILRLSAGFFDEDDGQDDAVYTVSISAGTSWY